MTVRHGLLASRGLEFESLGVDRILVQQVETDSAQVADDREAVEGDRAAVEALVEGLLSNKPARGTRQIIDAQMPLKDVVPSLAITILRTDYPEVGVLSGLDDAGFDLARFIFTNRTHPGNVGGPDLLACVKARLYASTAIDRPAASIDGAYTAATATTTQTTANSTARIGSWTNAASAGGFTNLKYTTTTGDYVEYDIAVEEGGRIVFPTYDNNGVGGVGEVLITLSSVEIASDKYTCPTVSGARVVNLRRYTSGVYVPLAKNLAAGTYKVRITRSAQSAASGRLYDAGMLAYAAIAFNAVGLHASARQVSVVSSAVTEFRWPGTVHVAAYPDSTKGTWTYLAGATQGRALVTIFDASGDQIEQQTIDMYAATTAEKTITLFEGEAKETHYRHIELLPTTNASATDYRMLAMTGTAFDEDTPGNIETDGLDYLSYPQYSFDANVVGTHHLFGPGNVIYSTSWRAPGGSLATPDPFVGGVHGEESNVTTAGFTIEVDGVALVSPFAVRGVRFVAEKEIAFTFTTTCYFPGTSTPFATLARRVTFRKGAQMQVETVRTLTAEAVQHAPYVLESQWPNGGDTRCDDTGGGFNKIVTERGQNYDVDATPAQYALPEWNTGLANYNGQYAVYAQILNPGEVIDAYADYLDETQGTMGYVLGYDSNLAKAYTMAPATNEADGILLPIGHVERVVRLFRIVPTTDAAFLLAA